MNTLGIWTGRSKLSRREDELESTHPARPRPKGPRWDPKRRRVSTAGTPSSRRFTMHYAMSQAAWRLASARSNPIVTFVLRSLPRNCWPALWRPRNPRKPDVSPRRLNLPCCPSPLSDLCAYPRTFLSSPSPLLLSIRLYRLVKF